MISLEDCITDETPITFVNKIPERAYEFSDGSDKIIFAKKFSVNEFIGEKLARIRKIRTPEYFLVLENDFLGKCCYGELDSKKIENIKIASYDFREKGYNYFNINEYGIGDNGFYSLLYLCPTEENCLELTNEILEMFALDTYMSQTDRFYYNIILKIAEDKKINLASIYDFGDSFLEEVDYYLNTLLSFPSDNEYIGYTRLFPQFGEMLADYVDVDLEKQIKEILEEKGLSDRNIDFQFYRDFSNRKSKFFQRILK